MVDIDGDGILDLLTSDRTGNSANVLLGNGNATTFAKSVSRLSGVSIATRSAALSAQGEIDVRLEEVNLISGSIGVGMSRLSVAAAVLRTSVEATKAAEGRIVDADIAQDSAQLVASTILQQAAAGVLAQAKQEPRLALRLLSG